MLCMEVCPSSYFWWWGYFWGPWVSFVLVDSHKNLQGFVSQGLTAYLSVFNLLLTQWIMAILSKGFKPDNFEPHNSLNLALQVFEAFVRILLVVNLSLNPTLLTFLALHETNLDDSIYIWINGLVVKALDSQSRGPMFKTTGWLQGWLSLSSVWGQ